MAAPITPAAYSLLDQLFFGCSFCSFLPSPGRVYSSPFHSSSSAPRWAERTKENKEEQIVIPHMPSLSIVDDSPVPLVSPSLLSLPLLKVSPSLCSPTVGLLSGQRSALIKADNDIWYRLKGCGALFSGFPIVPLSPFSPLPATIRGCAFADPAIRELFFAHAIGEAGGNKGIGYAIYDKPVDTETGRIQADEFAHPSILRCCILMSTKGNRRLGDHAINGIETILCAINKQDKPGQERAFNYERILSAVPSHRVSDSLILPTWLQRLQDEAGLVDAEALMGQDKNIRNTWTRKGPLIPTDMPDIANPTDAPSSSSSWSSLWSEAAASVNQYLCDPASRYSLFDLLLLLYSRLGAECGLWLGRLHRRGIAWGSYQDRLGIHCNAHANNFIIKDQRIAEQENKHSESSGGGVLGMANILAPVDFDMSFTRASYRPDEPANGASLNGSFDDLLALEFSGLALSLAGDSELSSGVTATVDFAGDSRAECIKWLLRDAAVRKFGDAYRGERERAADDGDDREPQVDATMAARFTSGETAVVYSIIRMALILTRHENA